MRAARFRAVRDDATNPAPRIAVWRAISRLKTLLGDLVYDAQPEGLINISRVLTSSFALIAVYLDPTTPTTDVDESYAILIAYVLFSIGVALFPSRRPRQHLFHIV